MLAPTMSAIVCAKSFELQAHVKGSLLFEDFLDGQIAPVRRSGTWWKSSFPDKSIQSLTRKHFSTRYPDDEAWQVVWSNLIVAVGLQEAGDDNCRLTR